MKIKRDTGHNPVRRLIRKALQLAHENKGLSKQDAGDLKSMAYQAEASIDRVFDAVQKRVFDIAQRQIAAVTAERDAACSQYQTLKEGASVNQELGATLIRQRDAAALDRDALAARCRELEGALRKSQYFGGVCCGCGARPGNQHADNCPVESLLTPATPAAKPEEHPCSCGRPECKYDRHHGNGPYPAAKPETTETPAPTCGLCGGTGGAGMYYPCPACATAEGGVA